MPSNPNQSVFCPAGQWTKVLWSTFVFKEYTGAFSVGGLTIGWRRYADLPPFYTEGTHSTDQTFGAIVAGAYCDFWFNPPVNVTVSWT